MTTPISIDHADIKAVLSQFNINEHDYYLLFENNVLYMVWCVTGTRARQLVTENHCIDVGIKDVWLNRETFPENQTLPTYVCVRYIMVAN